MKKNCCLVLFALWCGPLLKADGSQIPAVLFAGSDGGGCGHEVANQLVQACFALRAEHASLSEHPLAWSQVANFNAVALSGLGQADADMSLGRSRKTIDVLNRYIEAGGGVLMLCAFGQMATTKPPQDAFLKLGITPEYLLGPNPNSTLEGIVLDKGLNGTPSDGFKLLVNGLRWLAGGSLEAGSLGGAKTEESLLRDPNKARFTEPYR